MAPTPITDIITQVRRQLVETTARFWSDTELIDILKLGAMDLWGAYLDLHQDHYWTLIDDGSVKQEAGASRLTGIPDDCFRIQLIEPLDTTGALSNNSVGYAPRKYNHPDFIAARTITQAEFQTGGVVFYDMTGPGAPIAAPVVLVAPKLSVTLALRLAYYPMLVVNDINPVPGGSDNALKAWTIAYAMAKEGPQGGRIPDAGWLAVYATEKQTLLTRVTPRQEQEADVVDGLFDNLWY